jgi:hypothetical protein
MEMTSGKRPLRLTPCKSRHHSNEPLNCFESKIHDVGYAAVPGVFLWAKSIYFATRAWTKSAAAHRFSYCRTHFTDDIRVRSVKFPSSDNVDVICVVAFMNTRDALLLQVSFQMLKLNYRRGARLPVTIPMELH